MENDNAIFQDLENFGKEAFSKWSWKSFGFLFGKILNYPKMDITLCRIEHCICCVCSFYCLLYITFSIKQIIEYSIENYVFLFLWGFKMRAKMNLMVLEIWQFGF